MPFFDTPIARVRPPPSTPRTCGKASPPPTAVDSTASRSIAPETRASAFAMNLFCSISEASSAIASCFVSALSEATTSSSALNREMPVFGSSRSGFSATLCASSAAVAKRMRPQLEHVTRCCASWTCWLCAIGTCMPQTAQQPFDIAAMTMWLFL